MIAAKFALSKQAAQVLHALHAKAALGKLTHYQCLCNTTLPLKGFIHKCINIYVL